MSEDPKGNAGRWEPTQTGEDSGQLPPFVEEASAGPLGGEQTKQSDDIGTGSFPLQDPSAGEAFLDRLRHSRLLAEKTLQRLRRQVGGQSISPERIAATLLDSSLLTAWQVRMLLAGHWHFWLSKYKLLEQLGQGGMGTVMKAEQTPIGRIVALKLLAKHLTGDETAVTRFRREIRSAAALNHPNIALAYDAEAVEDAHFLVMEYLDGEDLENLIRRHGYLPPELACELIRQAALGLQHAHEQGMIHRDIKPSNLLLTRQTGRPVVKILDFGLARLTSEQGESGALTGTNQIMGTADYIAPEQARDAHSADIRSDIYSLGLTLYRLLTGQVAFAGETALEKITARLDKDPPSVNETRPELPVELAAVVAKMTARNRAQRYQTPEEVVEALLTFATVDEAEMARLTQPEQNAGAPATAETLQETRLNEQTAESAPAALEEFFGQLQTGASEKESSSDSHVRGWLEKRSRRDRWQTILIWSGAVLFLIAVTSFGVWKKLGETRLVVDWPAEERQGARLEVDGIEWPVPDTGLLVFPGSAGVRELRLSRTGFKPIEKSWTFDRGEEVRFRPEWIPKPATVRQQELAALEQRIDAAAAAVDSPASDRLIELREDLLAFQIERAGTAEAQNIPGLLARLLSPFDQLKREDIPRHARPLSEKAPVVGLFGDPRLKHWGDVRGVAWSPDGSLVASGSRHGTVVLWDAKTGRKVQTLLGQNGRVVTLAFSPDGELLASGSGDKTVRLWDVSNGEQITQFDGHADALQSVAFSPDGSSIASADEEGAIVLWDVESRTARYRLSAHDGRANSVAFSPDGKLLASGGDDEVVRLWDAETGEPVGELPHEKPVTAVAFGPDGNRLLSGSRAGKPRLWDVAERRELQALQSGQSQGRQWDLVAFSPDGRWIAAGRTQTSGGSIDLWEAETGRWTHSFRRPHGRMTACDLAFSPDGRTLAVARREYHDMRLWDVETGTESIRPAGHSGLTDVAVTPDGRRILSTGGKGDGTVRIWTADGEAVHTVRGSNSFRSVAVSPDGRTAAIGGWRKGSMLWDMQSRRKKRSLIGMSNPREFVFSPNGRWLAAYDPAAAYDSVDSCLYDAETASVKAVLCENASWPAFLPDGRLLLVTDGQAELWNVETPQRIRSFELQFFELAKKKHAVSPDGKLLLRAKGGSLGRYKIETGKKKGGDTRTQSIIWALAASPDNRTLASSHEDGTIRLWNYRGVLVELQQEFPLGSRAQALTFAPDGRHLIAGGSNGVVYVLRLQERKASDANE